MADLLFHSKMNKCLLVNKVNVKTYAITQVNAAFQRRDL